MLLGDGRSVSDATPGSFSKSHARVIDHRNVLRIRTCLPDRSVTDATLGFPDRSVTDTTLGFQASPPSYLTGGTVKLQRAVDDETA